MCKEGKEENNGYESAMLVSNREIRVEKIKGKLNSTF